MKKSPIDPILLDFREAAKLLSISESSLRNHTRSGLIPHVPIGRRKMYSREMLERMVKERALLGNTPYDPVPRNCMDEQGKEAA